MKQGLSGLLVIVLAPVILAGIMVTVTNRAKTDFGIDTGQPVW